MKAYYYSFETKVGPMHLAFTNKGIVKLALPTESKTSFMNYLKENFNDSRLYKGKEKIYSQQILRYLEGDLKDFDVDVDLYGTPFQQQVWQALKSIRYGCLKSYKDIAVDVAKPKAYRAVGGANNKNPIPIIIPCHRVIGHSGGLVGYGGGIDFKVKLLQIEGIKVNKSVISGQDKYYIENFKKLMEGT